MESAGSIRKRKLPCDPQDQEQEEDEEAKIHKFFALVQNIRESRDRWIKMMGTTNKNPKNVENRAGVWNPKFEPQDFVQDPAVTFPVAVAKGATHEEDRTEKGLDLKLSL